MIQLQLSVQNALHYVEIVCFVYIMKSQ